MNLPDNTELVNLRLELARERDRADAFRHAFNVEVLKVMRAAVIQATISADEEIARLKDENERLRKAGDEVVSRIQVCTEDLWCSIHRWNAAKEGNDHA